MGLWILRECLRALASEGDAPDLDELLREAAHVPAFVSLIDQAICRFHAGSPVFSVSKPSG